MWSEKFKKSVNGQKCITLRFWTHLSSCTCRCLDRPSSIHTDSSNSWERWDFQTGSHWPSSLPAALPLRLCETALHCSHWGTPPWSTPSGVWVAPRLRTQEGKPGFDSGPPGSDLWTRAQEALTERSIANLLQSDVHPHPPEGRRQVLLDRECVSTTHDLIHPST